MILVEHDRRGLEVGVLKQLLLQLYQPADYLEILHQYFLEAWLP